MASPGAGPTISSFPQGFANGLSVRGIPLLQSQVGQVFWLNNSTNLLPGQRGGSDSNRGTYLSPFATLQGALNSGSSSLSNTVGVVPGRGDIIMVGAGHAETISSATALSLNQSGVAIIGMGAGSLRPTFTLGTANTATINVTAANISIQNCIFVANFLNIAALFTLTNAPDFAVDNCEVRDTSAILNFLSMFVTDTTDHHADGLQITRNKFALLATSGAVNLFVPSGTADRVMIADNSWLSLTTNAGALIPQAAGKILTNFLLLRNHFNVLNAAGTATGYLMTTNSTTNTGYIDGNFDSALPTTPLPITLLSGYVYGINYHADAQDKSGYIVPAQDS